MYAYRAYIDSLLSYQSRAKQSKFTAALFYKDTAGNIDDINSAHANEAKKNVGLQKRASFTDEGSTVDMIGCIDLDVFFQDWFMLNEVNVKIWLMRNKNSFCLMSDEANASYKSRSSVQSC